MGSWLLFKFSLIVCYFISLPFFWTWDYDSWPLPQPSPPSPPPPPIRRNTELTTQVLNCHCWSFLWQMLEGLMMLRLEKNYWGFWKPNPTCRKVYVYVFIQFICPLIWLWAVSRPLQTNPEIQKLKTTLKRTKPIK